MRFHRLELERARPVVMPNTHGPSSAVLAMNPERLLHRRDACGQREQCLPIAM
jgi:hypothetical protein